MRFPRWLVLAVAPALLLAGCGGGDATAQLTVRARVNVCRSADDCVVMPAAGAQVRVVDAAGAVVADGPLTDDGTLTADVDPGQFVIRVSMLSLVSDRMTVTVRSNDKVEATLNLPRLTASR